MITRRHVLAFPAALASIILPAVGCATAAVPPIMMQSVDCIRHRPKPYAQYLRDRMGTYAVRLTLSNGKQFGDFLEFSADSYLSFTPAEAQQIQQLLIGGIAKGLAIQLGYSGVQHQTFIAAALRLPRRMLGDWNEENQ